MPVSEIVALHVVKSQLITQWTIVLLLLVFQFWKMLRSQEVELQIVAYKEKIWVNDIFWGIKWKVHTFM